MKMTFADITIVWTSKKKSIEDVEVLNIRFPGLKDSYYIENFIIDNYIKKKENDMMKFNTIYINIEQKDIPELMPGEIKCFYEIKESEE